MKFNFRNKKFSCASLGYFSELSPVCFFFFLPKSIMISTLVVCFLIVTWALRITQPSFYLPTDYLWNTFNWCLKLFSTFRTANLIQQMILLFHGKYMTSLNLVVSNLILSLYDDTCPFLASSSLRIVSIPLPDCSNPLCIWIHPFLRMCYFNHITFHCPMHLIFFYSHLSWNVVKSILYMSYK